jgi:hypothetical protein
MKGTNCAQCDCVVHQRMNANGFLLPYDLFSWNKQLTVRCLSMVMQSTITIYIQNSDYSQYYILCARWVLVVTPDSSSVFLVALWECCLLHCCWSTAYLVPRLEVCALPHSPPLGWPHFPQGQCILPLPRRLHELLLNTLGVPLISPASWDIGSTPVLSLCFSKISEYQLWSSQQNKHRVIPPPPVSQPPCAW